MLGCLCKALLREDGATHLQNGETFKSEWLSSTSVRKECLTEEVHEDFMETLEKGKESSSYSTVRKWAAAFKRGKRALRMMGSPAAQKMPPLMKMSRSCTPWLCVL